MTTPALDPMGIAAPSKKRKRSKRGRGRGRSSTSLHQSDNNPAALPTPSPSPETSKDDCDDLVANTLTLSAKTAERDKVKIHNQSRRHTTVPEVKPEDRTSVDAAPALAHHTDGTVPSQDAPAKIQEPVMTPAEILKRNTMFNRASPKRPRGWKHPQDEHSHEAEEALFQQEYARYKKSLLKCDPPKVRPPPVWETVELPDVPIGLEDPESVMYWYGSGVPLDKYFGQHATALPTDAVLIKLNQWESGGSSKFANYDSDASFDDDYGYGPADDDERILTDEDEPTPATAIWNMPVPLVNDTTLVDDAHILDDYSSDESNDDEHILADCSAPSPSPATTIETSLDNVSSALPEDLADYTSNDSDEAQDSCDDDDSQRDDTDEDAPSQALAMSSRKIRRLGDNAEHRLSKVANTGKVPRPKDSRMKKRNKELSFVREHYGRVRKRLETADGGRKESWLVRRSCHYSQVIQSMEEELGYLRHAKQFPKEWAEDLADILSRERKRKKPEPVVNEGVGTSALGHTGDKDVPSGAVGKKRQRESPDEKIEAISVATSTKRQRESPVEKTEAMPVAKKAKKQRDSPDDEVEVVPIAKKAKKSRTA